MNDLRTVTRIAITYNPPTFKFEYTTDLNKKYHKCILMKKYFDECTSRLSTITSMERSFQVISIVEKLVDRHAELRQVPAETIESLIGKLFSTPGLNDDAHVIAKPPPTAESPSGHARIRMEVESGTLMISPMRVSKNPLKISKDLDLKLYRDSFSSSKASPAAGVDATKAEHLHSRDAQQMIASKSDSVPIPQIEAEPKVPTFNVCGDLNRASEEELTMAKKQMSNIFEEKQVLPSDAGFEYDKRMDFDDPDEESSWD